jgi:hypothetical protein
VALGPAVNAYAAYGLDDMFDVKLDFAASNHAFEVVPGTSDRRSIYTTTLGISYKLDVLEWIPYFGAHLGWLYSNLPDGLDMGTEGWVVGGMLGLDYAMTPSFGLGVMNQVHLPVEGGSFVDSCAPNTTGIVPNFRWPKRSVTPSGGPPKAKGPPCFHDGPQACD